MTPMRTSRCGPLALLVLLVLAGCARQTAGDGDSIVALEGVAESDTADVVAAGRELGRRWARWRSDRPPAYRFVYANRCFCIPMRLTIEVRGDSARVVAGGAADSAGRRHGDVLPGGGVPTIDSLFVLLDDAVQGGAAEVRVRYDDALDYPREGWIDRDRGVADEEYGFEVDSLVPIEP
jgi:hypothetical protein